MFRAIPLTSFSPSHQVVPQRHICLSPAVFRFYPSTGRKYYKPKKKPTAEIGWIKHDKVSNPMPLGTLLTFAEFAPDTRRAHRVLANVNISPAKEGSGWADEEANANLESAAKRVAEEIGPPSGKDQEKIAATLLDRLQLLSIDGAADGEVRKADEHISMARAYVDPWSSSDGVGTNRMKAIKLGNKTGAAIRAELYQRLISEKTPPAKANVTTEKVFEEATEKLAREKEENGEVNARENAPNNEDTQVKTKQGGQKEALHEEVSKSLRDLDKFLEMSHSRRAFDKVLYRSAYYTNPIMPDPSFPKLFGQSENLDKTGSALQNGKASRKKPTTPTSGDAKMSPSAYSSSSPNTSYRLELWQKWDKERAEKRVRGLGPRNAFEEMIEWTREGRMWPYPIDNEYMLNTKESLRYDPEIDVSFVEHVFLEPYWRQHKVPKSKPVEHFMELVLTGLSKNPFITAAKKREHIDWFAAYFKQALESQRYGDALKPDE